VLADHAVLDFACLEQPDQEGPRYVGHVGCLLCWWLTPDEMLTWRTVHVFLATLPAVLGGQLQCDAQLSFIEYYVLASLSDQPEHRMRMSQLAILANSELSRLSHLVGRLEKRGFVRREADPCDGRFTHAILTPAGHPALIDAAPGHVENVRQLIFDVLDNSEQHALRTALGKITARYLADCATEDDPSIGTTGDLLASP
jgi:DNA-binding MarR family transcriptional regulator